MALLVGLTGGMGSGKSTVSSMLEKLGAVVIDADAICRDLVQPGQAALQEMVEAFGRDILLPDQSLDRKKVAARVFADEAARHQLEAILHPRVFEEEHRIYHAIAAQNPKAVVILDAPLLIESENYRKVDQVVVVSCPEEVQVQRILARGNFEEKDIRRRLASQMPLSEKIRFADFVIHNDSNLEELEHQVEALFRQLKKNAEA